MNSVYDGCSPLPINADCSAKMLLTAADGYRPLTCGSRVANVGVVGSNPIVRSNVMSRDIVPPMSRDILPPHPPVWRW